jgi:hypothetical protein
MSNRKHYDSEEEYLKDQVDKAISIGAVKMLKGDKGDSVQGEKGDKGEKGEEGKAGKDGKKGEKGERGEKGSDGKQGSSGQDGKIVEIDEGKIVKKITTEVLKRIPETDTMNQMGGVGVVLTYLNDGNRISDHVREINFSTGLSPVYEGNGRITVTTQAVDHNHTSAPNDGGVLTNDEHDGFSEYADIAVPDSPAADKIRLYAKMVASGLSVLETKFEDGTTIQPAQDNYLIAKNKTPSTTITKGQVVYSSGSVGGSGAQEVILARADDSATLPASGVVLDTSIGANNFGRILTFGTIDGLDTRGGAENWAQGDRLFVSATVAGALTNVPPPHPNLRQRVAIVLRVQQNTGSLLIAPIGIRGDHEGTNQDTWKVGSNIAGAKSITLRNGFDMVVSGNPSATRAITIPNADGTLALTSDIPDISTKADKVGSSDIEITDTTKGFILTSPNSTRYRITVGNDGSLTTTAI